MSAQAAPLQIETYRPFPRQQEFHRCPAKYRLFGGAAGPGKSRALLEEACIQALETNGCNTLLLRRTFPELEKSIVSKFRSEILPLWRDVKGFRFNDSLHTVFWPNGSTTQFGYCATEKDIYQYQGGEYLFIGVDELTMFTYAMWKFLTSRNRCPIPGSYPCMAGASNPGNIGHDWVKRMFVLGLPAREMDPEEIPQYKAEEYAFIPARVTDNPIYANDQNYLSTLRALPTRLRRQFLDGDWDDASGAYFSDFDRETTELAHDEFLRMWGQQYWQPIWVSIDWGTVHHAYVAWHTFLTIPIYQLAPLTPIPENTRESRRNLIRAELENVNRKDVVPYADIMVTYREYLIKGLGEEALAEEVVRHTPVSERSRITKIFLSPETGFESDLQRGFRMGSVFVQRNMPRAQAAYNDRVDGWRLMHDKLRDRIPSHFGVDGHQEPRVWSGWVVTSQCPQLLDAIPWAVADPDNDGDIIGEGDSPLLDVLDGARYGIASYIYADKIPAAERKKEVLSHIPVVGPHRFSADKAFDVEERKASAPVYFRRATGKRHH